MNNNELQNYCSALYYRHEEVKRLYDWALADEIVDGWIDWIENTGYTDGNAVNDYDNLAINGEIIEKGSEEEEDLAPGQALYETENYWVLG